MLKSPLLKCVGIFFSFVGAESAVLLLIYLNIKHFPQDAFDGSLIENSQLVLLGGTAAVLVFISARFRQLSGGMLLATGFLATMFCRELDYLFDKMLYHGAWLPFAVAVASTFVALAAYRRRTIVAGLSAIAEDPGVSVLALAMSILLFFSRLAGMSSVWRYFAPGNRMAKHVAEEGLELFGYALLAMWSVRLLLWIHRRYPSSTDTTESQHGRD
ncbi:MAG: hypothetical protein IJU44_05715 [Kiritimatiellae bacterium]|nr:hypothetical protein [Kiritimatiellia bacterium]